MTAKAWNESEKEKIELELPDHDMILGQTL
jgi:hypothetical protein